MVIAGDPDKSLLIQAVRKTHARIKMPPQGKLSGPGNQRSDSVGEGRGRLAGDGRHRSSHDEYWAFQPVSKPPVPSLPQQEANVTDIDRFVRAKLEEKGLKPVRQADKHALIRRATFDLIGLPPTPEEVDAFVNDSSPDAFRKGCRSTARVAALWRTLGPLLARSCALLGWRSRRE